MPSTSGTPTSRAGLTRRAVRGERKLFMRGAEGSPGARQAGRAPRAMLTRTKTEIVTSRGPDGRWRGGRPVLRPLTSNEPPFQLESCKVPPRCRGASAPASRAAARGAAPPSAGVDRRRCAPGHRGGASSRRGMGAVGDRNAQRHGPRRERRCRGRSPRAPALNEATRQRRETRTSKEGLFVLALLPPGQVHAHGGARRVRAARSSQTWC